MKAYNVNILLLEERYHDALSILQTLDTKKLGAKGTPVVENQIACCKAQLGNPTEAIKIAEGALPRMEIMGPDYSASGNLVLGTAKMLAGQPLEAVPYLQKAYTTSANAPVRKTIAAFYLGEAFSALGKSGESREAYQNANKTLPNSKFGLRALERLN